MGLFCVNLHVRTTDHAAVESALDRRRVRERRVLPAVNGWTTVYEAEASNQDDGRIRDLGSRLSRDAKAPAVAFLVHDSDIACYWLFENGRQVDEFNSCPGYFDGGSDGPSGGRPDVLHRFCRPGVGVEDLKTILGSQETFAEGIIEGLADALGIDPERALADYRDLAEDDGPDDFGGDDEDHGGGPGGGGLLASVAGRINQWFGGGAVRLATDPRVRELVEAVAAGDVAAIDRLVADGVPLDGEAPVPPPSEKQLGIGLFLATAPQMPVTPLFAAVLHRRRGAAERLLEAGADPNRKHPLFGTAAHIAAGAGDAELLRVLLDHGSDPQARSAHGQTPLTALNMLRASREQMVQGQATILAMGVRLPPQVQAVLDAPPPTEGWAACERLLREYGGR